MQSAATRAAVLCCMAVMLSGSLPARVALALESDLGSASAGVTLTGTQVDSGRLLYARHCSTCHGAELQGGAGVALSGDAPVAARLRRGRTAPRRRQPRCRNL